MIALVPSSFARPELLASPDWLAENVSRPGLRTVDCRWRVDGTARQLFANGHIPGAVFLDWMTRLVDPNSPLPFALAGPEAFADAMLRAGVGDGMTVVVYDDANSIYACRVWWSLWAYGFDSVRVLDGGWPAWQRSGRPGSTGQPQVEPATFTPRADPRRRLSGADVRALLGSREVALVDVRAPAQHRGQEGSGERRGHIPGAINVPVALLTRPGEQVFRGADQLARLFREAGLERARRVVVYDESGIAAAKTAFALTLLGYPDVAVYDGGWADWSSRPDNPIQR